MALPSWWEPAALSASRGNDSEPESPGLLVPTSTPSATDEPPPKRRSSLRKALTGLGKLLGVTADDTEEKTAHNYERGELPAWWADATAPSPTATLTTPTNPHVAFFRGGASASNPHMGALWKAGQISVDGDAKDTASNSGQCGERGVLPSWWVGMSSAPVAAATAAAAATPVESTTAATVAVPQVPHAAAEEMMDELPPLGMGKPAAAEWEVRAMKQQQQRSPLEACLNCMHHGQRII